MMSDSETEEFKPDVEVEKLEQTTKELDEMFQLLQSLDSTDKEECQEAQKKIDAYLEAKQRKIDEERLRREMISGCRTTTSKTVINKNESELDRRKRLSDEFKYLGNESFKNEDFTRAIEYYTSAILQYDENPALFTNRAQAYIKEKQFAEAIEDCRKAIKLSPTSPKAHVHLARALQGQGEFQKAIDILEIAEQHSETHTEVIRKYRLEIIADMKKSLLKKV